MSGSDLTTPPPSPKQSSNIVPPDYSSELSNAPDITLVKLGAGGYWDVIDTTIAGLPPSQQGLPGNLGKRAVFTNDPHLDEPDFAGLGLWSLQLANTLLHITLGYPLLSTEQLLQGGEGFEFAEELQYLAAAIQEYEQEGVEGELPPPTDLPPETQSVLDQWLSQIQGSAPTGLNNLPDDVAQLLSNIKSTDPNTVFEVLASLADLDSLNLSPEDLALVKSQLYSLAEILANANELGGSIILNLTIPELLGIVLINTLDYTDDASLSTEQKDAISLALMNIGQRLASANFESLVTTQEPSQEYLDLQSGDPARLGTLFGSIVQMIGLPEGISNEEFTAIINGLAQGVAGTTSAQDLAALFSVQDGEIQAFLEKILNEMVERGEIPETVAALFLENVLPAMSHEISRINETALKQAIRGMDPDAIENALAVLAGIHSGPPMNENEQRIVMGYLKALTLALSFMAQIRAIVTQLETGYTQDLAEAKLCQLADEVTYAKENFIKGIEEIHVSYTDAIKQARKARRLKRWMPLIGIVLAIVSLVIIVASIVATVLSAGAASPLIAGAIAITGKLVALMVGLACTVVVLALTLADAICTWATGKGMWDRMTENAATNSAIAAGIQIIIMLIAAVVTFGATIGVAIASAVKTMAEAATKAGIEVTLKTILKMILFMLKESRVLVTEALKELTTRSSVAFITILGAVAGAAIAGLTPYLIIGMTEFLKLLGVPDEKAALGAAIFAIIIAIIAMVGMAVATGSAGSALKSLQAGFKSLRAQSLGSIISQIANSAKTAAAGAWQNIRQAIRTIQETVEKFVRNLLRMLRNLPKAAEAVTGMPAALRNLRAKMIFEKILQALKQAIESLKTTAKDPFAYIQLLDLTADALRIGTTAYQAKTSLVHYKLQLKLAGLEEELAALEAVLIFFSQLEGIDQSTTIENILQDSDAAAENWTNLVTLIGSFIRDASARIGELTTKGAY